MKRFASHAFLALLVLAMVPSVNCAFDGDTTIFNRISWSGCYEKEDGEERVVLNLKSLSLLGGEPGDVSDLLSGCVWLQKNGQPLEGPYTLEGETASGAAEGNGNANMTAKPFDITVKLVRKPSGLITVEFGEEEPMEDLQRQAEYVEVPICPTQCPQEEAP